MTSLAKFARVLSKSCEFGASGHRLISTLTLIIFFHLDYRVWGDSSLLCVRLHLAADCLEVGLSGRGRNLGGHPHFPLLPHSRKNFFRLG